MKILERPAYRIYPGGRIELVRRVPTGTVVLTDAGVAADRLSQGYMVYVDREKWEDIWMDQEEE